MRKINFLVVHCTATPQTATIASIQKYWRDVLKWKSPGYHYIICPDGNMVQLLSENMVSNGVAGYNSDSVHISYIGGVDAKGKAVDNRTPEQKSTLLRILQSLKGKYPAAKIQGHRDFSPDKNHNGKVDSWERIKECPCFDAIPEYAHL